MPPRRQKRHEFLKCTICEATFIDEVESCHEFHCNFVKEKITNKYENTSKLFFNHKEFHIDLKKHGNKQCHDFILIFILYGSVQNVPPSYKQSAEERGTVFIHPATMQECQIARYEQVLVSDEEHQSLHFALPCDALQKTSVAFSCLDNVKHKPCSKVLLSKYYSLVPLASKLTISGSYDDQYHSEETFKLFVQRMLCNTYVSLGDQYQGQHDGVPYEFKIESIQTSPETFSPSSNVLTSIDTSSVLDLDVSHTSTNSSSFCMSAMEDSLISGDSLLLSTHSSATSTPKTHCLKASVGDMSERKTIPIKAFIDSNRTIDYFQVRMRTEIQLMSQVPVENTRSITELVFSAVGGLHKQLESIKKYLEVYSSTGFPHGLLFHGPSGTGKTLVASSIMSEKNIFSLKVTPSEFLQKDYLEGGNMLESIFEGACEKSPSIIVLDEIDKLCELFHTFELNRIDSLISSIDKAMSKGNILLIATAEDLSQIDRSLVQENRLDIDIEFTIPSMAEREQIFQKLLDENSVTLTQEQFSDLTESTHGCTGFDLQRICQEAECAAYLRYTAEQCLEDKTSSTYEMSYSDLKSQVKLAKPDSLRNDHFHVEKVHWDDVAGMHDVKTRLKQAVELPLKYGKIMSRFSLKPSKGILLYGPPGCSKTMIAKALATESGLNFIPIKGSELLSKWVGESERAIRELFERAKKAAPCIVFFDEIDALVSERVSSDGSAVGNRVVTQLLTEMDGYIESDGVFVMAATNRPDMVDPAFLRPGRLCHSVYVPLPDAETRLGILSLKLAKMPSKEMIDLNYLVTKTDGYSGAEVVAICNEAGLLALSENFPEINTKTVIQMKHFEKAMETILPRIPKETIALYENWSLK